MVGLRLYVEGGGDSEYSRSKCREGFRLFLDKAGMKGRAVRIVACGGRRNAYDRFCTALRQGSHGALLLVDSEEAVTSASPWTHVRERAGDGWQMPSGATDHHCHFMVQCMENWFLADRLAVAAFFGAGFEDGKWPAVSRPIEEIAKAEVYQVLARATKQCAAKGRKGRYHKGGHGFDVLGRLDPAKVMKASPWAERFMAALRQEISL